MKESHQISLSRSDTFPQSSILNPQSSILMRRDKSCLYVLICAVLLFFSSMSFAKPLTPVGQWIQISDKTNKPHSIILIYKNRDELEGKVIKAFPENGIPPQKRCTLCSGELHNAPIIGLTVMHGFTQASPNKWTNGRIVDPDSGKVYRCNLTLDSTGKKLNVRGYIGFSLLGRTQVWTRR